MLTIFSFILGFGLLGCGAGSDPSGSALIFQVQLPSAFARTEKRRENLLQRAIALELELEGRSGWRKRVFFPPNDWGTLVLKDIAFPQGEGDQMSVRAKIWDRERSGAQRLTPALSGTARFKASELALSGPSRFPVRLSLRVPVAEYD
jgi:hypothetical protein